MSATGIKFRVYYGDGMTRDGYVAGSADLPRRGVQAIVQKNDVTGWHTESRGDYYLMKDDGLWHPADFDGLFTELLKRRLVRPTIGTLHRVLDGDEWKKVNGPGFHAWLDTLRWVLHGETIGNDRFQEIFQEALASADFGRKQGYLAGERKP